MDKETIYVFPPSMEVKGNTIPAGYYQWRDMFEFIVAHYMGDDDKAEFSYYQEESILLENERIWERV